MGAVDSWPETVILRLWHEKAVLNSRPTMITMRPVERGIMFAYRVSSFKSRWERERS
jgi:hypothetical protein